MSSIHNLPDHERGNLLVRLKKIEGQAKGVQRMIEEGRDCLDVMTQIAAIRSAANALGGELLENYALRCLQHPEDFLSPKQAVEQAVHALVHGGRRQRPT